MSDSSEALSIAQSALAQAQSASSRAQNLEGRVSTLEEEVKILKREVAELKKFCRTYCEKVVDDLGEVELGAHTTTSIKYDLTKYYDVDKYDLVSITPIIPKTRRGYFTQITFSKCVSPKGVVNVMSTNTLPMNLKIEGLIIKKPNQLS